MAQHGFDAAISSLDEIERLLGFMLQLAQRSASSDCSQAERALLQRDFDALRERVDLAADIYQREAVSALAEKLSQLRLIMETREGNSQES